MPATDVSARMYTSTAVHTVPPEDSEAETELGPDSPRKRRPHAVINAVRAKRHHHATDNEREDSNAEEDELMHSNSSGSDQENAAEAAGERAAAVDALSALEVQLAQLQDELYSQKMARLDLEIALLADESHPELTFYKDQIQQKLNDQLQRLKALFSYQVNAVLAQSHASRCSAHETFVKGRISARSGLLGQVTQEWFNINQEVRNRQTNKAREADNTILPNKRLSNLELNKFSRTIAPEISRATNDEINMDMHEIGLL